LLDFVVSANDFGKPVNADLKLGLATAPVLYASQEFPELNEMMERKFSKEGDVDKVQIIS
jgi:hexaprenyl-diphosphate synthase